MMQYNLTKNQFYYLLKNFNLVPLIKSFKSVLDPTAIFEKILDKNSVLLHSPFVGKNSRYSIIATNPLSFLYLKNKFVYLNEKKIKGDPFEILRKLVNNQRIMPANIPFNGGLIGFFSYDIVHYIEKIRKTTIDDLGVPDFCFGLYHNFIIHDNHKGIIKIVSIGDNYDKCLKSINDIESKLDRKDVKSTIINKNNKNKKKISSNFTREGYIKAIKKVKEYIFSGDTYQVNLSQRFSTIVTTNPLELYKKLVKINPSPFSAFLDFRDIKLISSSPERLVRLKDGIVETRPIAGTRKRGFSNFQDKKMEIDLKTNSKELAEHTMLVDLERNDLGRVCKFGSVHVDEKFTIEKYSHVMHLVSCVKGKIDRGKDAFDVIKAVFPGGTITGCPKVRTMEIIDELEPTSRGPYTGSIGYIDYCGNMDLNIIIRTILVNGKKAFLQVGGGIVADSTYNFEYDETIAKAKALFEALES